MYCYIGMIRSMNGGYHGVLEGEENLGLVIWGIGVLAFIYPVDYLLRFHFLFLYSYIWLDLILCCKINVFVYCNIYKLQVIPEA